MADAGENAETRSFTSLSITALRVQRHNDAYSTGSTVLAYGTETVNGGVV